MTSRSDLLIKAKAVRELRVREARVSFWAYCKTLYPDFYMDSRPHLKELCDTLQDVKDGTIIRDDGSKYRGLIINMPPRHGKSRTLILFVTWLLGRDSLTSAITIAYNEELATEFSRYTRDEIKKGEDNDQPKLVTFSDVFPDVKIKHGDASVNKWSLEGSHFSYLGVGLKGTITGRGAKGILVIDEPVKSAEESFNDAILAQTYSDYTQTIRSRVEPGGLTVIVHTRWNKRDLSGRILDSEDAPEFYSLIMKANEGEDPDKMLCPDLFSWDDYKRAQRDLDPMIFEANYNQKPIDKEGAMYPNIDKNKWHLLPTNSDGSLTFTRLMAYVDPAEGGGDYFATVFAGLGSDGKFYTLDLIYNRNPLENNTNKLVELLNLHNIRECFIETNMGGASYAREVSTALKKSGKITTVIKQIKQTKNKETRILMASPIVINSVLWPSDIGTRHSEAWAHLLGFSRIKNKHDDIEDALTGLIEQIHTGKKSAKVTSRKRINIYAHLAR